MNVDKDHTAAAKPKTLSIRKLTLTAMFACLAFVLNTCVYFPSMAPFQHFVNVLSGVFLGPYYAFAAALICGLLRMMCGRTIQAVVGAVFGAFLSGLLYQKTHKLWAALVGEVIGTGFISAMVAYPLMRAFYALDAQSPFYYIPFYAPSSIVGGCMGIAVLLVLKKAGVLQKIQAQLER